MKPSNVYKILYFQYTAQTPGLHSVSIKYRHSNMTRLQLVKQRRICFHNICLKLNLFSLQKKKIIARKYPITLVVSHQLFIASHGFLNHTEILQDCNQSSSVCKAVFLHQEPEDLHCSEFTVTSIESN